MRVCVVPRDKTVNRIRSIRHYINLFIYFIAIEMTLVLLFKRYIVYHQTNIIYLFNIIPNTFSLYILAIHCNYIYIYIYIYLVKVANLAVECSMPYKQNVV